MTFSPFTELQNLSQNRKSISHWLRATYELVLFLKLVKLFYEIASLLSRKNAPVHYIECLRRL